MITFIFTFKLKESLIIENLLIFFDPFFFYYFKLKLIIYGHYLIDHYAVKTKIESLS